MFSVWLVFVVQWCSTMVKSQTGCHPLWGYGSLYYRTNMWHLWSLQINFSEKCVMSSCVKPLLQTQTNPIILLHAFDRPVLFAKLYSGCVMWAIAFWACKVHSILFQLLFRMEVLVPIAGAGWVGDLGCGCSWLGLLWFRFICLLHL